MHETHIVVDMQLFDHVQFSVVVFENIIFSIHSPVFRSSILTQSILLCRHSAPDTCRVRIAGSNGGVIDHE